MFIGLSILFAVLLIGLFVLQAKNNAKQERMRVNAQQKKEMSSSDVDALLAAEKLPVPGWTRAALVGALCFSIGGALFHKVWFYAEPGYIYHVRTILGNERCVDGTGYSLHLVGRINDWKKAMTVQSVAFTDADGDGRPDISAESEGGVNASATMKPLTVVMLDQVDSKISATVRYRIPTDCESFLKMAHDYRTPENLLRTALIPAFQETIQATGSLMAAEEYYSGRRTEFNAEFENQMSGGIYLVTRQQELVPDLTAQAIGSADASAGIEQAKFGKAVKVRWKVRKQMKDGIAVRKTQNFIDYGISVVEARVTDLTPNNKFIERMQLKQQAAADRAIAQEKRVQEEEQRLLAIAKGDREVAENQAEAKKKQITRTTAAETERQLVVIGANKRLQQAEIDKQTAKITKEKADIDAERIKVLADAEAYKKQVVLNADNALAQKLDTEIEIHKVWADALKTRRVPQFVMGGGGEGTPVGADSEASTFMRLLTIDAAKRLNYDRGIAPAVAK